MYGSANWWKRLGHFSLRLDMNGNHSNRVSMINEDRSLEPVKSTTRDTGLNCEANVSYQPAWGGIDFSTSWNYQYSLNSVNDNNTYTRYYNFRLEGYVDLPLGIQLRTDGAYTFRNGTNIRKGEDETTVKMYACTFIHFPTTHDIRIERPAFRVTFISRRRILVTSS